MARGLNARLAVLDAAGLSVDETRGELGRHPWSDRRVDEAERGAHHEAEHIEQVDVRFRRDDQFAEFGDRHTDQGGGELHSEREMQTTDALEEARVQTQTEAEQEAGVAHQTEQRTVGQMDPFLFHAELFRFLHRPTGVEAEHVQREVGGQSGGEQERRGGDVLVASGHLEFAAVVEHQVGDEVAEYATDDHLMWEVSGDVETRDGHADDHQHVTDPDRYAQLLQLLSHQYEVEDHVEDRGGHHCMATRKARTGLAGHRKLFEWRQIQSLLVLDGKPIRTTAKAVQVEEMDGQLIAF